MLCFLEKLKAIVSITVVYNNCVLKYNNCIISDQWKLKDKLKKKESYVQSLQGKNFSFFLIEQLYLSGLKKFGSSKKKIIRY